ncbi:SPOR domain-containing protein [Desulfovibrio sp. OttesenSCG-928-G11]|nr:SPOR domain-containing protein [Desulfovibrio sp. OttesenSCG-928-G11]
MTQEDPSRGLSLADPVPASSEAGPAGGALLRRGARNFEISLSPARMLGGLLLLGLGFVCVFCLGVVIGRGHEPEAGIPELARIMPEPAQRNAPRVIDADSANEPAPGAQNSSQAAGRPGIIAPADLEYRAHLKEPPLAMGQKAGAAPPAQARTQNPSPSTPARTAENKAPAAQPTPAAAAGEQRTKNPDQQIYHYSYQAASFKDSPSCDSFAAKLTRAGFKTRTEKIEADGKIWYRVMVDFTGRPDDTDALRDKLKAHGVPKALLRGKTPAQ